MNAIEGADALSPAEVAKFLADIPDDWRPSIRYVSAVIGPAWDRVKGSILIRLRDYTMLGVTLEDVQDACAAMSSPSVQASVKFPDDWLREFAAAVRDAKTNRLRLEEQERERTKRAEYDKISPAERKKNQAKFRELARGFNASTVVPPASAPESRENRAFMDAVRRTR